MDLAQLQIGVSSKAAVAATAGLRASLLKTAKAADAMAMRAQLGFKKMAMAATSMRGILAGMGGLLAGRAMITTMAQFEQSMADARAVMKGITENEFKDLNMAAREMGKSTVFSATEAGQAIKFMGMAGFNAQKTMDSLGGVLDLAAASSIDLGTAADISTNVLSTFGLKASEMSRVADVMASAQGSANTNMYELAEALKYSGPVFDGTQVKLEDASAAIAVMANRGVKGSMAGTSLRQVFMKLQNPTGKLATELEKLGYNMSTFNVENMPFEEIVLAVSKMDSNKLSAIFGPRGIIAAKNMKNNTEEMLKYAASLRESAGEAKRMADVKLDTLIGDWKLLKSAIAEVTLAAGDSGVSGSLRDLVQSMTKAVRWIGDNWNAMLTAGTNVMISFQQIWEGFVGLWKIQIGVIKNSFLKMLDFLLEKFADAMNKLGRMTPDTDFTQGVRGKFFEAARQTQHLRVKLNAPEDWGFGAGDENFAKIKELENLKAQNIKMTGFQVEWAGKSRKAYMEEAAANKAANDEAAKTPEKIQEITKELGFLSQKLQEVKAGFQDGFKGVTEEFGTLQERSQAIGETMANSLDANITDGLMSIIDGTKSVKEAFRDMANQIIMDLIRVMIQQLIVRAALKAVGGFMHGGGVVGAGVDEEAYHGGGIAGMGGSGRMMAGSSWRGSSRFSQGGLAGDEVPIIAHQGEVVFNEDQMQALGSAVGGGGGRGKVEIVNVTDPRQVDERIMNNPDAILNVMSKNRTRFRQVLGVR